MSCDAIKSMRSTLSINPYVYSYNNPISYSDASGLIAGKRSGKYGGGGGGGFGDSLGENSMHWGTPLERGGAYEFQPPSNQGANMPVSAVIEDHVTPVVYTTNTVMRTMSAKDTLPPKRGPSSGGGNPGKIGGYIKQFMDGIENPWMVIGHSGGFTAQAVLGIDVGISHYWNPKAMYDFAKTGDNERFDDILRVFGTGKILFGEGFAVSASGGPSFAFVRDGVLKNNFSGGSVGTNVSVGIGEGAGLFGYVEGGKGFNTTNIDFGIGGGFGHFSGKTLSGFGAHTIEIPVGQFITSIVGAIGSSSSGPAPFYDPNNSDPYNFGRNPNPYGPIKFKIVLLLIEIDI